MDTTTKAADPTELCGEMMRSMVPGEGKSAGCPMAKMGKTMAGGKAWMLLFPGLLLMFVGAAVIVWPGILPWLLGGTSIVLGILAFGMALGLKRVLAKLPEASDAEPREV